MPYSEVTRINDIGKGDACLTPAKQTIYQNPIDEWLDNPMLLEKYGKEEVRKMKGWAKAKAPLDPRTDAPLPDWAVDVLRLGRIGYKGRIRIVMSHAEDILRYRIMHNKEENN